MGGKGCLGSRVDKVATLRKETSSANDRSVTSVLENMYSGPLHFPGFKFRFVNNGKWTGPGILPLVRISSCSVGLHPHPNNHNSMNCYVNLLIDNRFQVTSHVSIRTRFVFVSTATLDRLTPVNCGGHVQTPLVRQSDPSARWWWVSSITSKHDLAPMSRDIKQSVTWRVTWRATCHVVTRWPRRALSGTVAHLILVWLNSMMRSRVKGVLIRVRVEFWFPWSSTNWCVSYFCSDYLCFDL